MLLDGTWMEGEGPDGVSAASFSGGALGLQRSASGSHYTGPLGEMLTRAQAKKVAMAARRWLAAVQSSGRQGWGCLGCIAWSVLPAFAC